jgi:ankyrin repeat protein
MLVAAVVMTSAVHAANSPVADAARQGDIDAVKALLKDGADVNAAMGDGMTALHWAAERGDLELTNVLLYAGANVAAVTRVGQYTPLHIAARTGNTGIVKGLLAANAVVDARTAPSGATALHLAAAAGAVDAINALLDAKADVNATEPEWEQTPLIFAASAGRTAAVTALLARGADANAHSKWIDLSKESQLDRAARALQTKILEATVPKGQVPTASQLQAATQAAREMLRSGKVPPPDPNAPPERNFNPEDINPAPNTKGGLTALHHAGRAGYVETASA